MSKLLKLITCAWFVNLIVFTVSLFLRDYFVSYGHWSASSWDSVFFTSAITKMCLSMAIVVYIVESGYDGMKKS